METERAKLDATKTRQIHYQPIVARHLGLAKNGASNGSGRRKWTMKKYPNTLTQTPRSSQEWRHKLERPLIQLNAMLSCRNFIFYCSPFHPHPGIFFSEFFFYHFALSYAHFIAMSYGSFHCLGIKFLITKIHRIQ